MQNVGLEAMKGVKVIASGMKLLIYEVEILSY